MDKNIKKVYIKTFGCAQNTADSERVKAFYWENGYVFVDNWQEADEIVINSCVVRESAENRVYGLIENIRKWNSEHKNKIKVTLTGCLVGTGQKKEINGVDQMIHIKEISYDLDPIRDKKKAAMVNISSGCNNMCSYCIVPMARGREISRPMEEILHEVDQVLEQGFEEIVLIGQNVNSYGSDLNPSKPPFDKGDYIVHMGKKRFKSLFHVLLDQVAKKKFKKVSFVSSNPWDFSDELIECIARHKNIDRLLHLPFQAGNDEILKKMNRSYTKAEYLELVKKIKTKIPDVKFSTDIIIGFPGEDEKAFEDTIDVCKQVGFEIAYLNKYSPRRGTVSAKIYKNDIAQKEKRRRWVLLNDLVNKKTNL